MDNREYRPVPHVFFFNRYRTCIPGIRYVYLHLTRFKICLVRSIYSRREFNRIRIWARPFRRGVFFFFFVYSFFAQHGPSTNTVFGQNCFDTFFGPYPFAHLRLLAGKTGRSQFPFAPLRARSCGRSKARISPKTKPN